MTIDTKDLTISKAHNHLKKGDFTAVELVRAYMDRASRENKDINAYLEIFDDALDRAAHADIRIKKGEGTLLTGIPCAIKDNILIKGKVASAASKMLEYYRAPYDATVVSKLGKEGVVFLGRTNMDEFAMGGSTENSAFGVTRNPHDVSRVAGGSSGGSAAAVAMGGALCALGSDTGGSIRQPASFCGVVGLKPTYGAVSRYGLMAMGSSLDVIGPIAQTVEDCEIVFSALCGKDEKDSTTIDGHTYPRVRVGKEKPVIGIPRLFTEQYGKSMAQGVLESYVRLENMLKSSGYEIRDIELPHAPHALPVYYIVMPAEVSSNMARYDGVKYGLHVGGGDVVEDYFRTRAAGFGREVKRRILLGTYVLSSGYYDAYYNRANAVRRMITDDFSKAFESVDVIITPTTPSPAFKIGEKTHDPLAMYLEDVFTVTANLTGMPALSVPVGETLAPRDMSNLPIGMQLTARHGDEAVLFEVGKDIEVSL